MVSRSDVSKVMRGRFGNGIGFNRDSLLLSSRELNV